MSVMAFYNHTNSKERLLVFVVPNAFFKLRFELWEIVGIKGGHGPL